MHFGVCQLFGCLGYWLTRRRSSPRASWATLCAPEPNRGWSLALEGSRPHAHWLPGVCGARHGMLLARAPTGITLCDPTPPAIPSTCVAPGWLPSCATATRLNSPSLVLQSQPSPPRLSSAGAAYATPYQRVCPPSTSPSMHPSMHAPIATRAWHTTSNANPTNPEGTPHRGRL